jgi:hypothetical protein
MKEDWGVFTVDDWQVRALCRGLKTDLFFEEEYEEDAKAICALCEVSVECLEHALKEGLFDDYSGIYGGLTPRSRRTLRRKRAKERTGK